MAADKNMQALPQMYRCGGDSRILVSYSILPKMTEAEGLVPGWRTKITASVAEKTRDKGIEKTSY
jgi:hypothetical protein